MGECDSPDQAFGFLLTIVAGLATMLGTAFIPALKWGNQDRVTSGALGFAAGVMLYVSFVDVLGVEATNFFTKHYTGTGCSDDEGHDHGHSHGHGHDHEAHDQSRRLHSGGDDTLVGVRIWIAFFFFLGIFIASMMDHVMALIPGMGHSHGEADSARDIEVQLNNRNADGSAQSSPKPGESQAAHVHSNADCDAGTGGAGHSVHSHSSSLERVSMVAFLALTLHNIPEGLATFLGASRGSMTVPFAIAMHNIPEGAAIAIPGYQVHGSVGKALRATFIAGLAQPVGALIGWLIIIILKVEQMPEFFYGATYSATAGIMVGVSILELIPEALQSAPARFVGMSIFLGFFVMELSIVLLSYVEA